MSHPLKVALLTIDKREFLHRYERDTPFFGTAPAALLQGFAQIPGVEIHVISCLQQPVQTVARMAPNIIPHGLYVPKLGWMRTLYQGCVRAVRRRLQELQPDIVHGQGTERDCAMGAVFSGFPNVLTIHGHMRRVAAISRPPPGSFYWLASKLERLAVSRTDGVICITGYTQRLLRHEASRTWVVPNAVDSSFFNLAVRPGPDRTILVVGTVCAHKNQNAFIRALDPLTKSERFQLLFCGDAAGDQPYVKEFFSLLATRPWCRFAGFAGREQLKAALGEATLLALPSLEENCPMVLLEAAAAGVPVVAAKVGGIPDLIDDGVTGLLCDPQEPEGLRTAVTKLLTQPSLARQVASQARHAALSRFQPEVIARRHVEIYQEVLSAVA